MYRGIAYVATDRVCGLLVLAACCIIGTARHLPRAWRLAFRIIMKAEKKPNMHIVRPSSVYIACIKEKCRKKNGARRSAVARRKRIRPSENAAPQAPREANKRAAKA